MSKEFQIFFLSIFLFLFSCSEPEVREDPLSHIEDSKVSSLLEKVFEASGGLNNWNALQSFKYHKRFALFLEDSTIEKSVEQFHDYSYQPEFSVEILSKEGTDEKVLTFGNGNIQETVNDLVNKEAKETSLMNQLQSSVFVISQPFKLADKGAQLSYEGIRQLEAGESVHVLKAVYDPVKNTHHTTPDTWWIFFDESTYLMVGYMVQHKDHFSLIKNLETTTVNGFTFPVRRISYRADADGKVLYQRAQYEYEGFVINGQR